MWLCKKLEMRTYRWEAFKDIQVRHSLMSIVNTNKLLTGLL